MKRSKIFWALVVIFVWCTFKSAGAIYSANSTTDYALLLHLGIGPLFYAITGLILLGEAATSVLLIARKSIAYIVGTITIVLECLNGVFTSIVLALHTDVAKVFYASSREARGMSERLPSEMDFMFSPTMIALLAAVYLAFWAVVYFGLRKTRPELSQ